MDPQTRVWMDYANKINRGIQIEAKALMKQNEHNPLSQQQILNSYAYYPRNLVMTLARYLPSSYEKRNVEELFNHRLGNGQGETKIEELKDLNDLSGGVRKRVLISSNFSTSFQVNHILECFSQLSTLEKRFACMFHPHSQPVRAWRKDMDKLHANQLTSKYK